MAADPNFAATPKIGVDIITDAEASRAVPGANIKDIFVAGASGSRIDWVRCQAQTTTLAGFVGLWVHDGVDWNFIEEISVEAITVSATQDAWSAFSSVITMQRPLVMQNGYKLGATYSEASSDIVVMAVGGNF